MSYVHLYDQIERYVNGELVGDELKQFEQNLQEDPAFAEEVELHRELQLVLQDHDFAEFRSTLVTVSKEQYAPAPIAAKKKIVRTLNWWLMSAAAAAAVLIFILWRLFSPGKDPVPNEMPVVKNNQQEQAKETPKENPEIIKDQKELIVQEEKKKSKQPVKEKAKKGPEFEQTPENAAFVASLDKAYEPYNIGTLMGANVNAEKKLEEAITLFEAKNWPEVIKLLQTIDEASEGSNPFKLRANAYFMNKQYKEAAADFLKLSKSGSYKYNAEWNLLLCYAHMLPQEKGHFAELLSKILDPELEHPYRDQALILEKEYDKIKK